jgi:hypothetical protein
MDRTGNARLARSSASHARLTRPIGVSGPPTSLASLALCGVAAVFLAMATMAALMNLFVEPDSDFEAFVLLAGSGP